MCQDCGDSGVDVGSLYGPEACPSCQGSGVEIPKEVCIMSRKQRAKARKRLKPKWSQARRAAHLAELAALRICGNCGAEYQGCECDVCGSSAVRLRRPA